jgi:hypothetical protein
MTSTTTRRRGALVLAGLLAVGLFAADIARAADDPSVSAVIGDLLFERPMGLVETVVGAGVAAVAWPLALPSGRSDEVVERCIARPARHTFTRSLGEASSAPRSQCSPIGLAFGITQMSLGFVERPIRLFFGRGPFDRDEDGPRDRIETGDSVEI